jgi:hypothetical protein
MHFVVAIIAFVMIIAFVAAFPATARIAMTLLAVSLAAVVAAFTAVVAPNRCGDDFQYLDRMDRIIAGNNQIARAWELLSCLIANYYIQAGAGMQSCGKGIVD